MFKKFNSTLILVVCFLVILSPLNAAIFLTYDDAYVGIVQIKLFSLSDDGFLEHISSGSGAIIDSSGLILTNYHVVTEEEDFDGSQRNVAYQICLTKVKEIVPECKFTAKLIASDKNDDLALLKIQNISGISSETSFSFLKMSEYSIEIGDDVTILGYPSIGGDTITISQGVVSGKTNKYNLDWVKTDADISFGNSGGAGVNNNGEIVGVTTRSHSDMLGSVGYLVDIKSINKWVNENKNKVAQTSPLENKMKAFTAKEQELKESNIFTNEYPVFKIQKLDDWTFDYYREDKVSLYDENDESGGIFTLSLLKMPFAVNYSDIDWIFKMQNVEYLSLMDIVKSEEMTIGSKTGKKIIYSIMGEIGKNIYIPHGEFVMRISYDYGDNEQDKEKIDNIISSLEFNNYNNRSTHSNSYTSSRHGLNITSINNSWFAETYENISEPVAFYNNEIKGAVVTLSVEKRDDSTRNLSNNELYKMALKEVEDVRPSLAMFGGDIEINDAKSYADIGKNINNAVLMEMGLLKDGEYLVRSLKYKIYLDDKIIDITCAFLGNENKFNLVKSSFKELIRTFEINNYTAENIQEEILSYSSEKTDLDEQETVYENNALNNNTQSMPDIKNDSVAENNISHNNPMLTRLKGKIMIKVEDSGKAYYINPKTETINYLGRPDDAFEVMRSQGVGITNKDLYKIPIGISNEGVDSDGDGLSDFLETTLGLNMNNQDTDGDGYADKVELEGGYSPWGVGRQNIDYNFSEKQKGKILLQVEKNGEAWYINPSDGKRYFLGRPADAFNVMRNLGLGISNNDFENL